MNVLIQARQGVSSSRHQGPLSIIAAGKGRRITVGQVPAA